MINSVRFTLLPLFVSASLVCSIALGLMSGEVKADAVLSLEQREKRAEFNYKMFCRGCHGPAGEGRKAVPHMNNFVGNFLRFQAGRDYLVQVPGSANAALDDEQLTEVLNWIVLNISGESLPENFRAYSIDEVSKLRENPLFEAFEFRKNLLREMVEKGIIEKLPEQPLK